MSSFEVRKFKNYICEYLIKKYGISAKIATDAVQSSVINDLLKEDAEMIMHDSIQYWAEQIWNEYNCILV